MFIVMLGAAESGVGAAILAQKQGMEVLVSDAGHIKPRYKEMLQSHGIAWEEGGHSAERILQADEVVKSPGIPDTAPMVRTLREHGTHIISEIEFAARYTDARMICITGSNGKTTTTSLIYHILQRHTPDVGLAGNIGHSLALQVAESPKSTYVIELSSFQLDNMYDFRADIAVLLNITPDHLDRYGFQMENYVNAKMRITQNQRPQDTFIYWAQDEHTPRKLHELQPESRLLAFSDAPGDKAAAATHHDGRMYADTKNVPSTLAVRLAPAQLSLPLADISIPGKHNLRNAMAAALACLSAGVPAETVRQGLTDFPGVEHRLEKAGTKNGVSFVNDSKATNVDACYCALDALPGPMVLILGGLDKGNDYEQIMPLVREKCRALVFMGVDNAKLHQAFDATGLPIADTASMHDCFQACTRLAQPGDTVLLSPCCASFDLFRNMEDRGEQFKECVREW